MQMRKKSTKEIDGRLEDEVAEMASPLHSAPDHSRLTLILKSVFHSGLKYYFSLCHQIFYILICAFDQPQ